jgi:hypothetical protein
VSDSEEQQRLKEIMEHPSYKLAYLDHDFMRKEELRPRRLEMELLKPEMMLDDAGIKSTVVAFGGTQVSPKEEGERLMAEAKAAVAKDPESHEAITRSFATVSSSSKPVVDPASWRQPTEVRMRQVVNRWR